MNQEKLKLIRRLTQPPKKDKGQNQTYFFNPTKNHTHQADLLSLPNDKGFKYLLVVIDISTKLVDAQPLRQKTAQTVLNAMKKIYERGTLKLPKRIEVDDGGEFKSIFHEYFEDKDTYIRRGKPGRHKMQAYVERANQNLGTKIFQKIGC